MKKIAVLIPCYNEAPTIAKVIKDYKKALPDADIYVFDNNSTDGTDKIAKKAGAIVKYEKRQGKGNVVRSMFRTIGADCYLMIDGDDTYPSESAKEMCDYILNDEADMVIGDRLSSTYFKENKRPFHNFGNKLVRRFINLLFKTKIKDVMTGYRAFFNILSFIAIVIGIILNVPPFMEYFQTGLVSKFPSLIVGGFFIVVGLLLMITGIILEVIAKKHRQLYELYLNK